MDNKPPVHAFFLGRAIAEALYEQAERTVTSALSELGKFDAEQRERVRLFTEDVMARANRAAQQATGNSNFGSGDSTEDLQATIDELRAEVAEVKSEIQNHRNRSV